MYQKTKRHLQKSQPRGGQKLAYVSRGVINWSTGGSTPLTPTVDLRTYVVVGMMNDVAQSGRCRTTLARQRLAADDGAVMARERGRQQPARRPWRQQHALHYRQRLHIHHAD